MNLSVNHNWFDNLILGIIMTTVKNNSLNAAREARNAAREARAYLKSITPKLDERKSVEELEELEQEETTLLGRKIAIIDTFIDNESFEANNADNPRITKTIADFKGKYPDKKDYRTGLQKMVEYFSARHNRI